MELPTMKKIADLKEIISKQDLLISKQHEIISLLEKENNMLKKDLKDLQMFCINFAADNDSFGNAYNIDFPNSEKGGQAGQERPTIFPDDSNLF